MAFRTLFISVAVGFVGGLANRARATDCGPTVLTEDLAPSGETPVVPFDAVTGLALVEEFDHNPVSLCVRVSTPTPHFETGSNAVAGNEACIEFTRDDLRDR
jgi:hypothetical protein